MLKKLLFVATSLLFSFLSFAVEVNDLYLAQVPVSDQSATQRNIALKTAMAIVIVKVGGDKQVLEQPTIKQALQRYQSFYSQFRYAGTAGEKIAIISFDESKINQLFADAHLPLWGSLRPQVSLWLVDEDGLARSILPASEPSLLAKTIHDFSIARGLPISLPLMDLTDIREVNVADIWGRFIQPIEKASYRYSADMSVIVRISNNSLLAQDDADGLLKNCQQPCYEKAYTLDWTIISDSNMVTSTALDISYLGLDKQQLLSLALDDITQAIYKRYALIANSEDGFIIDVANIETMSAYVEVSAFLHELSSVKSAILINAQGHNRRYHLNLVGSQAAFLAALKLNKQLQRYVDPLADIDPNAVPVFLWNAQ